MREYRTTLRMTIMKSNEPAKTKKAMKTMNFLSMAALALVGAMMTGCSNDDNIIDEPQQPVNMNNVVTLTATVGFDETSTTRALTSGGVKTFAVGEKIAVVYKSGGSTLKAESAVLKAGDIASGNKLATFTFELTSPDKTQDVTYIYPASMANADGTVNYDALATQDGTMTSLSNNLDLATYTAAWTDASLPTGTLTNQLAVCALTLKNSTGSSPITSGLTQVTISDGTNSYLIAPESSTFGEDVIYVAIRPVTAALQYTASDGTNNYTKTATSRTYAAGDFYNLGLRMVQDFAPATAEAVDLGLSVKWANMNVGAESVTNYGKYYAWGATTDNYSESKNYSWANTPYYNGDGTTHSWTKYTGSDSKPTLEAADDAARANWGGSWRMPTETEMNELLDNTTRTWQTNYNGSGVNGLLFTSKKEGYTDKSIFLPAAGVRLSSTSLAGTAGYYWSSTLSSSDANNCRYLYLLSTGAQMNPENRYYGMTVRAVQDK
mgnify:CR=1 FL=1